MPTLTVLVLTTDRLSLGKTAHTKRGDVYCLALPLSNQLSQTLANRWRLLETGARKPTGEVEAFRSGLTEDRLAIRRHIVDPAPTAARDGALQHGRSFTG